MQFSLFQKRFFASMAHSQEMLVLFDHLPGVFFLAKDAEGRFIAANNATMQRLGAIDPSKFIGTTDEDYVPDELVKSFRDDDRQVIKTGKPLLNRLEAWLGEQRELQWFLTTKLPIKGRNGRNIGVMAVIRRYEADRTQHSIKEAADAVAYLKANPQRLLTTAALAKAVGTSERNLHRKIQLAMGLTPYELMLRIRIQASAQKLVSTSDTLSEVALSHGFCDQSAFTKHFRQRTGMTPRQFRLRHQG
jgi:AraC-like DNA-binding protein